MHLFFGAKQLSAQTLPYKNSKLYAFGYGLSYTTFEYSNLQVTVNESSSDLIATISFEVKNKGNYGGDEVAQLYLVDEVSSVVTPVKQLKRF